MSDAKIHKFVNQGVIFCEWCGAKPEDQKSGCRLAAAPSVSAASQVEVASSIMGFGFGGLSTWAILNYTTRGIAVAAGSGAGVSLVVGSAVWYLHSKYLNYRTREPSTEAERAPLLPTEV